MIKRFFKNIFSPPPPKVEWKEIEYFDEKWEERISYMAKLIPAGVNSIVDLGCGKMWLQKYLAPEANYIPVDYKSRGSNTVICNFNEQEFPQLQIDLAFVSGAFEYVIPYQWFVENIAAHCRYCVISYCAFENYGSEKSRRSVGWVNHLTSHQLIALFNKQGMQLENSGTVCGNCVFLFSKIPV